MRLAAEKNDFLVRPATLTLISGHRMKMETTKVWQNRKVPHLAQRDVPSGARPTNIQIAAPTTCVAIAIGNRVHAQYRIATDAAMMSTKLMPNMGSAYRIVWRDVKPNDFWGVSGERSEPK